MEIFASVMLFVAKSIAVLVAGMGVVVIPTSAIKRLKNR